MANPPFGIKGLNYDDISKEVQDEYLPIKTKDGPSLFLQLMINKLKIGGKCATVFPDGKQLFGTGEFRIVREYLMRCCKLTDVVSLPSGIFENTGVKTVILCFEKVRDGREVLKVVGGKKKKYEFGGGWATESVKFWEIDGDKQEVNIKTMIEKILISHHLNIQKMI